MYLQLILLKQQTRVSLGDIKKRPAPLSGIYTSSGIRQGSIVGLVLGKSNGRKHSLWGTNIPIKQMQNCNAIAVDATACPGFEKLYLLDCKLLPGRANVFLKTK